MTRQKFWTRAAVTEVLISDTPAFEQFIGYAFEDAVRAHGGQQSAVENWRFLDDWELSADEREFQTTNSARYIRIMGSAVRDAQ